MSNKESIKHVTVEPDGEVGLTVSCPNPKCGKDIQVFEDTEICFICEQDISSHVSNWFTTYHSNSVSNDTTEIVIEEDDPFASISPKKSDSEDNSKSPENSGKVESPSESDSEEPTPPPINDQTSYMLLDDHFLDDNMVIVEGNLPENIPDNGKVRVETGEGEFVVVAYDGTTKNAFLCCEGMVDAPKGTLVYPVLIDENMEPETIEGETREVVVKVRENPKPTKIVNEGERDDEHGNDNVVGDNDGNNNGVLVNDNGGVHSDRPDQPGINENDQSVPGNGGIDADSSETHKEERQSPVSSEQHEPDQAGADSKGTKKSETGVKNSTAKNKTTPKRGRVKKNPKKSQRVKPKKVPAGHFYWYSSAPLNPKKHDGVMVVAMKKLKNRINYGVAFCSPKDTYNKYIGRELASERLKVNKQSVKVRKTNPKVKDILDAIHHHLLSQAEYPGWLRKGQHPIEEIEQKKVWY